MESITDVIKADYKSHDEMYSLKMAAPASQEGSSYGRWIMQVVIKIKLEKAKIALQKPLYSYKYSSDHY